MQTDIERYFANAIERKQDDDYISFDISCSSQLSSYFTFNLTIASCFVLLEVNLNQFNT